ncbi:unnamed protein product [Arctogadus glacialis]
MCLRLGEEVLLLLHRPSLVLGAEQHRLRRPEDLACHVVECQPSAGDGSDTPPPRETTAAGGRRPSAPSRLPGIPVSCAPSRLSAAAQSPAGVTIDRQRLLRDSNLSMARSDPCDGAMIDYTV